MQAATKVQITLIPDAQPKSLHDPCQKQTFVRKPGASRPGGPEEHDGKVTDPAPPPSKCHGPDWQFCRLFCAAGGGLPRRPNYTGARWRDWGVTGRASPVEPPNVGISMKMAR